MTWGIVGTVGLVLLIALILGRALRRIRERYHPEQLAREDDDQARTLAGVSDEEWLARLRGDRTGGEDG